MKYLALFTVATFGMLQSSHALVDAKYRTDVDVWANAWDKRTSGDGCSPRGCTPDLTRDEKFKDNSRWSCKKELKGKTCKICYTFDEPQDIVKACAAFWKGDERERTVKVTITDSDGKESKEEYTTSGETEDFECAIVKTDETKEFCIEPVGLEDDEWLSILETAFYVK